MPGQLKQNQSKNIPSKLIQNFLNNVMNKEFIFDSFNIPAITYESGNISLFETMVICLLCKNLNPKYVLEYGTFNGRTTTNIAANTSDKTKIVTVDLPKEDKGKTVYPLEGQQKHDLHDELGYIGNTNKIFSKLSKKVKDKIYQTWSDTALFPQNKLSSLPFDFIFVDASHKYENVFNDTINVFQMIVPGGIILWHDYQGWPGVTQALNEIYALHKLKNNFAAIKNSSLVIYYEPIKLL